MSIDIENSALYLMMHNEEKLSHVAGIVVDKGNTAQFVNYDEEGEIVAACQPFYVENLIIGIMGFISNNLQPVPLQIPDTDNAFTYMIDFHYSVVGNEDTDEKNILLLIRIDGVEYLFMGWVVSEIQAIDVNFVKQTILYHLWFVTNTISNAVLGNTAVSSEE